MLWLILIIVIAIIIFVVVNSGEQKLKPGQIEIEVSIPNPETCSYQSFKNFVDNSTVFKLEAVLKELDKQGIYLKPAFKQLVESKIKQNYYVDNTIQPNNDFISRQKSTEVDINIIELKGVHLKYRKNNILENCYEGDLVDLIPEPSNEFDKNAVMVKKHGKLLGYLDAEKTENYLLNLHRFKAAKIKCIDYDDENDYLYVNIELSLFSESEIDLHSEFEDLKTNKISRKFLYPKKEVCDSSNYFYKKKVVITGTFLNFPYRNEMAMMLWEVGADIDTAVTERTDILIIGDNAGWSKQEKVLEMQTECIDEEIFLRYFPNYKPKFI